MKRSKKLVSSLLSKSRRHPFKAGLVIISLMVLAGLPWFFMPKSVAFSYAEQTCTKELTVFPGIVRQATSTSYDVSYEGVYSVGSVDVFATNVCFAATQTPEQGDVRVATGPWGTWLAPQVYTLAIGEEPQVDVAALAQPIPTTKPIEVNLDQPDELHTYRLIVDAKTAECVDREGELSCDVSALKLSQGKKYPYELTRQFKDDSDEPITTGTLETLRATKVVKSSVKKDETVYAKPKNIRLTLDKELVNARATLKHDAQSEEVEVSTDGKVVTVNFGKELERKTKYALMLTNVEATDGSTLIDDYTLPFTMSGGPTVSGISIGSSKVDLGAQAVISFDQELSDEQDITKLVSIKGGSASVTKLNARQVGVQLQEMGRCQAFTISVASGALSKYDIESDASWSHSSRTICYTTSVYGYSLQGRPLVAYRFGNSGPVTLYTGAIHGNEISSMYMMQSWINDLEANPDKIGNRQIVVIPNINPDGVIAGTRNNSRDVNLSRNFPTDNWVSDIDDTNGPNKGGGGKKPLSEPEAAALASYTSSVSPRLLVSYHAVGSLVVGDPGFSGQKAAEYARLVGYRNATGQAGTFDYDITGSYEEWAPKNAGIPAMVIELGSYTYHNFAHHRAAMWAMLE